MTIFTSHFWYHKSQRNGIFLLAILIIILQVFIFADVFSSDEKIIKETPQIIAFQHQIDSLKMIEIENRKPKIFPFNPNYITDFKGEQLGMSLVEIDRLLAYRKSGKFINSKSQFQQVTKISDSLLAKIAPFFKFPDWVEKQNSYQKENPSSEKFNFQNYKKTAKSDLSTNDLNKATSADLQYISGIGEKTAERIIQYRSKLQGFTFKEQLYEVWGLQKEIADKTLETFTIKQKPIIKTVNINSLSFKELLRIPYMNYELCRKIFDYKDEVAEIQQISELKNIKDFPLDIYNRLVLYLHAE
ncbi:helix-hairpin-helix domain-containing protein [Polaribacter sp.]|uniref:helix-hairpin-helix domain-containing protein n=1 Tax=Polaribacter sp. TaxID=1920175 RepID=UPI004048B34C